MFPQTQGNWSKKLKVAEVLATTGFHGKNALKKSLLNRHSAPHAILINHEEAEWASEQVLNSGCLSGDQFIFSNSRILAQKKIVRLKIKVDNKFDADFPEGQRSVFIEIS